MVKFSGSILFLLIFSSFLSAQPVLRVFPEEIEYEDLFHRLENIYFKNEGTQPVVVDSMTYRNQYYFIRFDKARWWPFQIAPGDSVKMDCIIPGFYNIPPSDTADTMYIYSNNEVLPQSVRIRIRYTENYREGIIGGQISDDMGAVENADVHIFYKGSYIVRSVKTDENGNYSVSLPQGWYTVAAAKDSFYTTFFGQEYDLINADLFYLEGISPVTANITLTPVENFSGSAGGTVIDSLSGFPLRKAVVVVRRGNHTPTKRNIKSPALIGESYTVLIKQDGSYSIPNINPGYYFIQSFSDFFVPSYYNSENSSHYWQSADSVYIDSNLSGLDIYMQRDSSLGGGSASGTVSIGLSGVPASDVIVYAEALNSLNSIFNYSFLADSGKFNLPFLPYGDYRLVAQKIGYFDAYTESFTIDSQQTVVSNLDLVLSPVTSAEEKEIVPETITLYRNYPNPFNPSTTIEFYLPSGMQVTLRILNVLGEEIALLNKDYLPSGFHQSTFDASGLSSGMYIVSLSAGAFNLSQKILLIK